MAASMLALQYPLPSSLHQKICRSTRINHLVSKTCSMETRVSCFGRQQTLPTNCLYNCPTEKNAPRVFVVSDLHTDYEENMEWVRGLSTVWYRNDVLIVAGDVAETYENFVITMSKLRERFGSVFFVPGNHDLWCRKERGKFKTSLEKLSALLEACVKLGIETSPKIVEGIGIIPIFSWYHKSFDKEQDITGFRIPSLELACKDFHACEWPLELMNGDDDALASHFDVINEKFYSSIEKIQSTNCEMITFSHFVPRQELCPEKRMLFYPNLPKIIGSDLLERRIRFIHEKRQQKSPCHVFGHTHFCWDAVIDGIRYVQAPLAYPRERMRRMNGGERWLPFCIYHQGFTDRLSPSYWSDYYAKNKRVPENVELAPWVAKFYRR